MDHDWENSLRSSLYQKESSTKSPPKSGIKIKRKRKDCHPERLTSEVASSELFRRLPTNTQSTPALLSNKETNRGSICPVMHEPRQDTDDIVQTGDPVFNHSYLSMIKKRRALLYSHSQQDDLHKTASGAQSKPGSPMADMSLTHFSRHMADDMRETSPGLGAYTLSQHGVQVGRDSPGGMLEYRVPSYMSETLNGASRINPADESPSVELKRVSSVWHEPKHRVSLTEPVVHKLDKKLIEEYKEKFRVPYGGLRKLSFAQSFTRALHTTDTDSWDRTMNRKTSMICEEDDDDIEDLLPDIQGGPVRRKGKVKNIRAQMNCCSLLWHDLKLWRNRKKYQKENNPVFQKQILYVESHFGSGTVSFFVFLRWLLLLDAALCVVWLVSVIMPQAVYYEGYSEMLHNFYYTNIIDGKKAMANTFMFYGGYQSTLGNYPLSLAYLFCIIITYFGSLFLVFRGVSTSLNSGSVLNETRSTYFNLTLCGWDYSLTEAEAVRRMCSQLTNTFRDMISETKARAKKVRTRREVSLLILRRVIAWILALILQVLGCTSIYFMINTDVKELVNSWGYSVTNEDVVVVYVPSILFIVINFVIVKCMSMLPPIEKYDSGKSELMVAVIRNFVLRIVNILALVASLYKKQMNQSGCVGTYLGQELYKLVILDTIIMFVRNLSFQMLIYFWRKKKAEFKIPPKVLIVVYRQSLVLLGTLVCPVMPLVGVVSIAMFFLENYLILKITGKPPEKRWSQSRHNTLFMALTAATLIILIIPVSIIITRNDLVKLSVKRGYNNTEDVCGPFGNDTLVSAFWVTQHMLRENKPILADIINVVISSTVLIPLIFIILAVVYFQRLRVSWQDSKLKLLFSELIVEREHNKNLMKSYKSASNTTKV